MVSDLLKIKHLFVNKVRITIHKISMANPPILIGVSGIYVGILSHEL